jgi:hypothetical protein
VKHNRKILAVAGVAAIATVSPLLPASAVDAEIAKASANVQPSENTVGTLQVKDYTLPGGGLGGWDLKRNTLDWNSLGAQVRIDIANSDVRKNGVVHENALDDALKAKLNAGSGPATLANWGEIFRNTIGNGSAELGQSSAGEGLELNTPAGTDQATFGNEADFAGDPVEFSAIKYRVYTTGENAAKASNNMPAIKFEMTTTPADMKPWSYTTLVYVPNNSPVNAWTTIDAKADAANHWGFTGTYFNADPARCGLNGPRCTYVQAMAVINGDNAKLMSVAVGKGRDFEFHGAVSDFTLGSTKYLFTKNGVTK